jgi:hypothetical protein
MKLLLVLLSISYSLNIYAQNQQLINWFAGADIVGTTGADDLDLKSDFYVREFELSAFSQIDQTWMGILTLAYHKESTANEEHLEVHEAFIQSSKIIGLTNIKLGKFFMGFGRLNRFHRHDWVFTEAPTVQKSFFGNEGAKDTGVEFKRLIPSLSTSLTLGVTKGDEFNHTHNDEEEEAGHDHGHVERAKSPTGYLRLAKFVDFTTSEGFEVALNYINRVDAESTHFNYTGLDFIYKDRVGKFYNLLLQSEIWARNTNKKVDGHKESLYDVGGYLYAEKGVDQHHAFGLRFDYYKPDQHIEEEGHVHSIDGIEVDRELKALGASYIYTNSEFMRTRLNIEYGTGVKVDDDPEVDSYVKGMVQIVFSIGAHPAHVF